MWRRRSQPNSRNPLRPHNTNHMVGRTRAQIDVGARGDVEVGEEEDAAGDINKTTADETQPNLPSRKQ